VFNYKNNLLGRLQIPVFVVLCLAGIFLFLPSARAENQPKVIINEVAWMGGVSSSADEWIELKNNTDLEIDLTNWILKAVDGSPFIALTGKIPGQGYYLLERTDDTTVPEIAADQIFTGALGDEGENLQLLDNDGNPIDEIICLEGWQDGDKLNKLTMERKSDLNFMETAQLR